MKSKRRFGSIIRSDGRIFWDNWRETTAEAFSLQKLPCEADNRQTLRQAGIGDGSAYRLLLTRYLMNRSFLGEMFEEGLANLALDVLRFVFRICGARGFQQDLFDFFPV